MSAKDATGSSTQNLGIFALIAIVVSSMIGGGVDALPGSMAQNSAVGPVLIAWIIAGVGVCFIATSFIVLSNIRPDLNSGVYMYAREGFGELIGFIVAWGYWLMTIFGNIAFAVMMMDSLNYFFPGTFSGGNNLVSIICASFLVWGYNFLVLAGARTVGTINIIVTIAKLIPLVVFISILGYVFNSYTVLSDVWGHSAGNLGSAASQVIAPMNVTLWSFIGIEGAVALSGRAKNNKDVGKATLIGFIISLVICMLVSILPFGVMPQSVLSTIPTPSTAGILERIVGHWGEVFMIIGVMISVLSGWLAWTLLCAEIPMVAASDGTFPRAFAKRNANGSASVSLWISSLIMQCVLFLVYLSDNAWRTMLDITTVTVLPTYLASTAFLFKLCIKNEYGKYAKKGKKLALISAFLGMAFCIFMLYAGGSKNVLLVPIILTLGIPLYIWSRKEKKATAPLFTRKEKIYLTILLSLDIISLFTFFKFYF